MNLNTQPANRKEMVKAIADFTTLQATYMFTPSYAYQIGPITVNRDGTITCHDEEMIEKLKPMLIEHGWLNANGEEPIMEEVEVAVEIHEEEKPVERQLHVEEMDIIMPVEGWSIGQLTNLLKIMFSKQKLINRMFQSDKLHVEESFVNAIVENPPETVDDFEARVQAAIDAESLCGLRITNREAALTAPFCEEEPTRWVAYGTLLNGIMQSAQKATRITCKQIEDTENEKYHANSWLMRMGLGGAVYKQARKTLLGHLNGYAAFKSEADMQAHKEKYAQLRKELREESHD